MSRHPGSFLNDILADIGVPVVGIGIQGTSVLWGFSSEQVICGVPKFGAPNDNLVRRGFDFDPVAFVKLERVGDFIGKAKGQIFTPTSDDDMNNRCDRYSNGDNRNISQSLGNPKGFPPACLILAFALAIALRLMVREGAPPPFLLVRGTKNVDGAPSRVMTTKDTIAVLPK